jgi:hypothetical protein
LWDEREHLKGTTMKAQKVYESREAALAAFLADNPQPAGSQVEVESERTIRGWLKDGLFRPYNLIAERVGGLGPTEEVTEIRIQTYYPPTNDYPRGEMFQSTTLLVRD